MVFQMQTMQLVVVDPVLSSSASGLISGLPAYPATLPPHTMSPVGQASPFPEPYLDPVFTQHWPDVRRDRIDLCDVWWVNGREALESRRRDLPHKTAISERHLSKTSLFHQDLAEYHLQSVINDKNVVIGKHLVSTQGKP